MYYAIDGILIGSQDYFFFEKVNFYILIIQSNKHLMLEIRLEFDSSISILILIKKKKTCIWINKRFLGEKIYSTHEVYNLIASPFQCPYNKDRHFWC